MAAIAFTFIVTSFLAAPTVLGITLDAGTLESIRHMRPPPLPPHSRSSGFPIRPVPNRPSAPQLTLHPQAIQQPSVIRNSFGQLQQNLPPGQQTRPIPQILESINRRPQHFSDGQTIPQTFGFLTHDVSNKQPPDSFLAAAIQQQSQRFNTPPFIQQGTFPHTVIDSSNRLPQIHTNGITTSSSLQNNIINQIQTNQQSDTLSSSISQQFNLNSQPQKQQLDDNFISATVAVQQPAQSLLIQNQNIPWGQTAAQPAEFFSDFNRTFSGRQFQDALTITAPPALGSAANDANKKALLKNVLSEDCPGAKKDGFCASPPRYPSQQVSQLISRCGDIVKALYVPVPQDDRRNTSEVKNDTEESLSSLPHFNSTSEMQRGNRQLWSWAKAAVEQETVCGADRQWVEPGYVRDNNGRWYVVLQAGDLLAQRVHLETCHNPGKPCSAIKCSSFSNKLASSHCVQRYSYSHLIVWDPDQQDACPHLRVFRFPTACVCYLGP